MKNNNKAFALAGVIGGVLYFIASALVHVGSGMMGENPDPGWASFAAARSGASEIFALVGSVCFLMGFISMYMMVKSTCGKGMQKLALVSAVGVTGLALFHGNVNCIEPLVYKVLDGNNVTGVYSEVDSIISGSFAPVDLIILVTFYLQLVVLVYGIFSGKFGVKKWMIIFNPIVGLIFGVILSNILPVGVSGISMGMRNLGEGAMYLIPLAYWNNETR